MRIEQLKTLVCLVALSLLPAGANTAFAQEAASHQHAGKTVAYQLVQWKTMHFDEAAKAKQHAAMARKLGCEVKEAQHGGHTDVTYRCTEWKTMEVADTKMADQWGGWLKASGFDVSRADVADEYTQGPEAVEFRLTRWKTTHGDGQGKEAELIDRLKRLGCEVVVAKHGSHNDIRYRAPTWRDVHVADHATAEQLASWLGSRGFEVKPHKH